MNESKNPINVDVSLSAKADLAPIIKATPKGFAYLSFLLFGKREANNERYIRLSKAQTDIDEKGVLEGRLIFNAKENTLSSTNQDFKQQIVGAIQDEEIQNLIACSIKAAENIKEGETEKEPSQDFINRWRNDAKQIHSEELQNIWGRLMAEEINNPDSISLRTLDTIKNISRGEAEHFINYIKYVIWGDGLVVQKFGVNTAKIFSENNFIMPDMPVIPFQEILKLRDSQLIVSATYINSLHRNWSISPEGAERTYSINTMNYLFHVPANSVKVAPMTHYAELTQPAQDICKILKNETSARQACRQDAIDFIDTQRELLVALGAEYIIFGHIEADGNVSVFEKYALIE